MDRLPIQRNEQPHVLVPWVVQISRQKFLMFVVSILLFGGAMFCFQASVFYKEYLESGMTKFGIHGDSMIIVMILLYICFWPLWFGILRHGVDWIRDSWIAITVWKMFKSVLMAVFVYQINMAHDNLINSIDGYLLATFFLLAALSIVMEEVLLPLTFVRCEGLLADSAIGLGICLPREPNVPLLSLEGIWRFVVTVAIGTVLHGIASFLRHRGRPTPPPPAPSSPPAPSPQHRGRPTPPPPAPSSPPAPRLPPAPPSPPAPTNFESVRRRILSSIPPPPPPSPIWPLGSARRHNVFPDGTPAPPPSPIQPLGLAGKRIDFPDGTSAPPAPPPPPPLRHIDLGPSPLVRRIGLVSTRPRIDRTLAPPAPPPPPYLRQIDVGRIALGSTRPRIDRTLAPPAPPPPPHLRRIALGRIALERIASGSTRRRIDRTLAPPAPPPPPHLRRIDVGRIALGSTRPRIDRTLAPPAPPPPPHRIDVGLTHRRTRAPPTRPPPPPPPLIDLRQIRHRGQPSS